MSKKTLETIFGSRVRLRLLKFFFRNYPQIFSLREVVKHLPEDPRMVKKEMQKLLQIGLLQKNGSRKKHV